MKIFVIAGEASGDKLASSIIETMQDVQWSGIGGPLMKVAGLQKSFFDYSELSLMGLAEILPHIPKMFQRIRETVEFIEKTQPDVVLSVDCPEFSLRVQKKLKSRGIYKGKKIHYVAPSVWAWRPKRAHKIAQFLDGLMCLLPFEPPYFTQYGLKTIFVGHSIVTEPAFAQKIQEIPDTIGLFFGSRGAEIKRIGPAIAGAARIIASQNKKAQFVVPTFARFETPISELLKNLDFKCVTDHTQKYKIIKSLSGAIATSGTIGLELAVADVPHVMCYKMNALTYFIGRRIVKTPYGHLANVLLQKEVVPEFVQQNCKAENIASGFMRLPSKVTEFSKVRDLVGFNDPVSPAKKAADFIRSL